MEKPPFDGYQSSRGYFTGSNDGEHVTIGAKADQEPGADLAQPFSLVSILKGILAKLRATLTVQLTGRKVQLRDVTADSSTTVNASGGTETITVQATSGYVARLVGFYALAPAVGASGTHKLEVQVGDAYKQSVRAEATFGSASSIQRFYAAGTITPNDVHVIQRNLQNIRFTNAVPLQIVYTNNTDANQTGTRLIRLLLEEEAIVS